MPIHDWTRVDAGLYHAFHEDWIGALARVLNHGGLPREFFAIRELSIGGPVPDVLALRLTDWGQESDGGSPGLAVAEAPPRTRVVRHAEEMIYLRRTDRIAIRHQHGELVAAIEIVSPGNKASKNALQEFVRKTTDFLRQGVHLSVIDPFPPGKRDPQGIHKAIWDEFIEEDFDLPPDRPLVLASYDAGPPPVAYVESVAVGQPLVDMPLFLRPGFYVPMPLEATYRSTWEDSFPPPMKRLLESPSGPGATTEGSGRT